MNVVGLALFLLVITLFGMKIMKALIKPVFAHCDTLDGPVVKAAEKALQTHNVNHALIWVSTDSEGAAREAFRNATDKLKTASQEDDRTATIYKFLEDIVRLHRLGEGQAYEGIKPAGSISDALKAGDHAVASGDLDEVLTHVKSSEQKEALRHHFVELQQKCSYDVNDLAAGREYVQTYAHFIHMVEAAIEGGESHSHHQH